MNGLGQTLLNILPPSYLEDESTGKRLCVTQKNSDSIYFETLSQDEITNFSKEYGTWNSRCYILSLQDIISIAKNTVLKKPSFVGGAKLQLSITDPCEQEVIFGVVDIMCQRSTNKWQAGRVKTNWSELSLSGKLKKIWGEIKWLIYKNFLSPTDALQKFKNNHFIHGCLRDSRGEYSSLDGAALLSAASGSSFHTRVDESPAALRPRAKNARSTL